MKKIHKGKAAGPDDIPIELLLALKEVGIQEVTKLLNTIYDMGEIPEDLKKTVFIPLPKKPGTTDCEQHRIISLMSHLTKVLLRVFMSRMRNKMRPEIFDTQFGFIADKGNEVGWGIMKMMGEKGRRDKGGTREASQAGARGPKCQRDIDSNGTIRVSGKNIALAGI
ncbi:uncharacterized protein LOC143245575 [Tachypleus tridentatus]|uniref:uncharacterized protein LOC143245575 n=1 Tax=Tachypleus tridentatus TaxID=6853 RepID=UPI003FD385CE